ncbi:glycosyltransferase family 24 protein [Saccharata proteae CBS 121410]|uniref:Glycosyltransferase family 24 protein n=1 Tax=Saccharata proteae CBS 121410 TaxID=1314787 RepID=A0A9P4HN87_9PEZI|nr:glycosyltransferase family 24 protein [Saccharata proteae CBS 121410]
MRAPQWLLSSPAAVLLGAVIPAVTASPPINVALRASFEASPYLVELLETAAEENATAYLPLLDRVAEGYFDSATTEQELYNSFLGLLHDGGHLSDPDALSSFQFALAIHSAAPRIEAHYQFYNTSVEPSLQATQGDDCEAWVLLGSKQYCDPELKQEHGAVKGTRNEFLPFDRLLGGTTDQLTSILYADITSPNFRNFHQTISKTAREGKTAYKLRHKPPKKSREPLAVNGYGVELALKRTDYIVIDDRQAEESGKEDTAESAAEISLEDEEVADLKPLSETELKSLGIKAASFVMNSENPLDTLLKLSQDFPKHSSAISAHNVSKEFRFEHNRNREALLPAGYNVLWINGVQVMPRSVDAFALLEHLRRERQIINGVRKLGFTGPEAISVLSHEVIASAKDDKKPQRYDWRDEIEGGNVIIGLNDIEKDKRYAEWPKDLEALLQRVYPGQLPTVRKDIFNAIMPVDFSDLKDVALVVDTLQSMVKRKLAIRWGLVPITNSPAAVEQAKVVCHLLDSYGLGAVMTYLQDALKSRKLASPHAATFQEVVQSSSLRRNRVARELQEVLKHEDFQSRVDSSRHYLSRLGAEGPTPPMFVDGVPVPRDDEWLPSLSMRVTADLQFIQRIVWEDSPDEDIWLPSFFLTDAPIRRNSLVIPEDEKTIKLLNMAEIYSEYGDVLERLPSTPPAQESKSLWAQLIVLGDFNTEAGFGLLKQATEFWKTNPELELIPIHTSGDIADIDSVSMRLFSVMQTGKPFDAEAMEYLAAKVAEDNIEAEKAAKYWESLYPLVRTLGCEPHRQGLVLNGRTLGALPEGKPFTVEDFETLKNYEWTKRIGPASLALNNLGLEDRISSPGDAAIFSSLVALSTVSDIPEGIFETPPTTRRDIFNIWNSTYTCITTGDIDSSTIQIVASVDPASEIAQRWIPILKVLSEMNGVHMRLFLNPKERLQEIPVKRFYRYVLDSKPSFDEAGSSRPLQAQFTGVPSEALLNLGMDVPPSWLVAPKECVHDLDNIKLSSLKGHSEIDALYELENILIEGHSRDVTIGAYPRGVQLDLSTEKNPRSADTIIMSNLGYFQFKANPGFFKIELQPGRSQEIYEIDSAGTMGYNAQPGDETKHIALMSFQGVTLYPRLSRKRGMEDEDVLAPATSAVEDMAAGAAQIADGALGQLGINANTGSFVSKGLQFGSSLLSKAGLASSVSRSNQAHAEINIFSVASGHLYERMLNIMILSVMKHTNHTVKFWFIEQFLSPSFKSFLPVLAAEYGFSYSLVTYKWPHWLRQQKEKQREIWGYKILFLDVLFPLDLDKVIFVDADQIVRTDMYDLVTHDLHGAPYGFVPMCDSRTEMEGFRFWKQGYWKNFLRGRPYHISALYVVDLRRFRAIAAGDRLRQQYHQLSADPNSLSNLDQDLPNNMQASLPIHSLPQEWLWCETWCSDESLGRARTIDLCNNPLTKEPKLERARRQVPEWNLYDEEIAEVARRARGEGELGRENEVKEGEGRKRDEL